MIYESYYGAMDLETGALCHHGVKGQKWGIRRYQNEDGTRTALGKARRSGEWKEYLAQVKGRAGVATGKVKERYSAYKEKSQQKKEEKRVADVEKAIKSGNLKRIGKYKDDMSNSQLQEAINRARLSKQLDDLKGPKESIVKKAFGVVQTTTNYMNTISNAYDAAKKLADKFKDPEPELSQDVKNELANRAKDYASFTRDNTEGSTSKKDAAYAAAYTRRLAQLTEAAKDAVDNDIADPKKNKKAVASIDALYEYEKRKKPKDVELPQDVTNMINNNAKVYASMERDNAKGSASDKDAAYTTAYQRYVERSKAAAEEAVKTYKSDNGTVSIVGFKTPKEKKKK